MTESKEVVNWEEKLAAEAKEAALIERPPVSRITLKSGIMKYMGDPVPDNKLDVIIVGVIEEHTLYLGKYDPDNLEAPDCFAQGAPGSDLAPHTNVIDPQHEDCNTCPHFQWGSDLDGGRGKACKETRKLAVIPAAAINNPESLNKAEVAIIKLPVTSVRNYSKYVNGLASSVHRPLWSVVTTISTAPHEKYQFSVSFDLVELVDTSLLAQLNQVVEASMASLSVPYDGKVEDTTPKKPKGKEKF